MPTISRGTRYCKYRQNVFQKEKCKEHNVNVVATGRDAGLDPEEQITKQYIVNHVSSIIIIPAINTLYTLNVLYKNPKKRLLCI